MGSCGLGPLAISLQVMAWSGLLLWVIGLPLAIALSRPHWPARRLVEALVSLPLVFPPIALGFFLLLLLGRQGWVNSMLPVAWRFELVFSFPALVLAAVIAGLPLMIRPVQTALQDKVVRLTEAAATLGKTPWQSFWQVTVPGIGPALATGLALGVGRGMGEVGMSLLLGGNLVGRTDTLSLALYNAVLDGDHACAQRYAWMLAALALSLFALLDRLGRRLRGV